MDEETVTVIADRSQPGAPVRETLLVRSVAPNRYVLVASPGLTMDLAADDLIEVDALGAVVIIARGGNVCAWILGREEALLEVDRRLATCLEATSGRLDGSDRMLRVLTIPVRVGFPTIERELGRLVADLDGADWFFGNVYDPADGVTPLNWWVGGAGDVPDHARAGL